MEKYHREPWARVPGGIDDQRGAAAAGLRELEAALEGERRDGVRWRLAAGHHPFASLALPLRTPELDRLLAKPLRSSSAVFAGHDHTMQFLRWPSSADGGPRPPVVVSGGGSDVGSGDRVNASAVAPGSSFHPQGGDALFARKRGFADCVVTREELRCDLVGGDGAVLFTAVVPAKRRAPPPPPPPPKKVEDEEGEKKPLPAAPDAANAETAAATPPPHSPPTPVVEPEEEKP